MNGNTGRRVGMSKRDNPGHLLKRFGGETVPNPNKKDEERSGRAMPAERPEDAPPEASSDEENQNPPMQPNSNSSDSEHDNRNADIVRTKFDKKTSSSTASPGGGSRKSTRGMIDSKNTTNSSQLADEFLQSSGEHLKDNMGFVKDQKKRTREKNGKGIRPPRTLKSYGKSSQSSSARSPPKRSSSQDDDPPSKKFKMPSMTPSPKKPLRSGFRQPSANDSSPIRAPKFKAENLVLDDSPEQSKATFVRPGGKDGLDSDSEVAGSNQRSATATNRRRQRQTCNQKRSPEVAMDNSSRTPVFKMPDEELEEHGEIIKGMPSTQALNLLAAEQKQLDFTSDSTLSDVILDDLDEEEETPSFTAQCPMCHEPVEAEFLRKYAARGRMNVSKQAAFCRAHKQKTAQETRVSKGYPEVDWDGLESRFRRQEDVLRDILGATRSSYFATKLSEVVELGKNRTLLNSDDSLTPGYYGPRGQRVMTDFIMRTFSNTLRQQAFKDRLVSARGYSGYVQAVLVPELAVRLIMEDMRVTEEAAREIMRESSELGEFLHEEARDVVESESEDD